MSTDVTPADPPIDPPAPSEPAPMSIPWWTRGDLNAFFGLGFNILVNVLTLTGLMIGVVAVPAGDVLGTILPALGVALILGNLYYTFLARRLARLLAGESHIAQSQCRDLRTQQYIQHLHQQCDHAHLRRLHGLQRYIRRHSRFHLE